MAELIIGLPRIERAVERLGSELGRLITSFGSVALPLPKSLCRDLVYKAAGGGEEDIEEISLRYFNTSLARVWWPVIREIPRLALEIPHGEVVCYEEDTDPRALEERGYRLASLLIRARISLDERIDPRPWLDLFKGPGAGSPIFPEANALIADGYVRYREATRVLRYSRAEKLWRLIPTPLEVIEMIARGYLGEENSVEAVRFAARYLGDYVVGGRDLTDAYDRLLRDREYMEFLWGLGLLDE